MSSFWVKAQLSQKLSPQKVLNFKGPKICCLPPRRGGAKILAPQEPLVLWGPPKMWAPNPKKLLKEMCKTTPGCVWPFVNGKKQNLWGGHKKIVGLQKKWLKTPGMV